MTQTVVSKVVSTFNVLTEGIPDNKSILLDAPNGKIYVIGEGQTVEETRECSMPKVTGITDSQVAGMIGTVTKVLNVKELTWESEFGKFEINPETNEFKQLSK